MTPFLIAFIVKPLFICLLFGAAVGIAKIVMRFIPEGKVKKFLSTSDKAH
jgi:hypothetical protein